MALLPSARVNNVINHHHVTLCRNILSIQRKCIKYDNNAMYMYVLNDMKFPVVCVFIFMLYMTMWLYA